MMSNNINSNESQHVYAAEKSSHLDSWLRKILQPPGKTLRRYVRSGMTVLDLGCGTGFFTIPMSNLVGTNGQVIAVDVQPAMLKKLEGKLINHANRSRIIIVEGEVTALSVSHKIDFTLAAYVFHELPDQLATLKHLHGILKQGGQILILEPNFVVTRAAFRKTIKYASLAGFQITRVRSTLFSRSILLTKGHESVHISS
jgi:ubiquinone/menaquinone biosynthesis C-methylase UbiE